MAFAPPRPQSIFGRSAPPQAQIDWRLGAQVGQNIGGGIQSAMQHLSKGFVDWQEGVAEGRRKDKIGELLRGQFPGMSDKEIKGGQENPNFLLGLKQIEQQAAKIKADAERQDAAVVRQIAAQQLAQQKFALEEDRFGLEEERFDIAKKAASQDTAKHEVDMGTRVREIAADITYMDKGELKIDPFELSRIHPALQKALLRVPRSELKTIEEDQGAYESMMEKARRPKKKGVKFVEETFTAKEHQHWAGLDDRDKMRLTGERPTMVIIGGSQQAKEWEEATGSSEIPKGKGFVFDSLGNFKTQFSADTESQGRFKQFEQALRDAKDDQTYQLTEKEVNAYFLADQTMNVEKLSEALWQHVRDPAERERLIKQFIQSKTGGTGGGPVTY